MKNNDNQNFTKWVSTWGTATSITDRKECVYAKNLTLRYPVHMVFDGDRIRLRFSNLTGSEDVSFTASVRLLCDEKARSDFVSLTKDGEKAFVIPAGTEVHSDELDFPVTSGSKLEVSIYIKDCTNMNAGTLVTGPLSGGSYAYGDFEKAPDFPPDLCRNTNWYYFLNTVVQFVLHSIKMRSCNYI